jgi:glycosyltransferase involved in cell wall biosynthesis
MDQLTYSFVIPAFNEQERIGASLQKIVDYIARQGWRAEVLVVNDGSRDNTAEVVSQYARKHPEVRLLENPGNRGKGYSVRAGMLQAAGDVVLFTDSDLSTPISEAGKLFASLSAGADVAIGSRWLHSVLQTQRQPVYRQLVGRAFNLLLWVLLRLNYRDTQCGFKAFTRRAARTLCSMQQIERWGFDAELLFLARKLGLRVTEVPVEWAHDHRSKIRVFRDGFHMVADLLIVRWYQISGRYMLGRAAGRLAKTTSH